MVRPDYLVFSGTDDKLLARFRYSLVFTTLRKLIKENEIQKVADTALTALIRKECSSCLLSR